MKMTRSNTFKGLSAAVVAVALLFATTATGAAKQEKQSRGVTNIVLVHGAWADGSSWSKVIPLLQARGFNVVAVQLPLTSLADDVATVKRALALVDGPAPACRSLVRRSRDHSSWERSRKSPVWSTLPRSHRKRASRPSILRTRIQRRPFRSSGSDQFGFLKLTPTGIREDFAQDLSYDEQTVLAATQGPTAAGAALGAPVSVAAWRSKPSWFVIAAHDRVVSPALQASRGSADERHAITLSSEPRGDVVPTVRGRLIHPQGGPRRPIKRREGFAIRVFC